MVTAMQMQGRRSRRLRSLPFKRRRENKTDYKARLVMLKSGRPRLVIRLTNRRAIAQLVTYEVKGDKTTAQADSIDLAGLGYKAKNTTACYMVGLLCGARAKAAGVDEAVADLGLRNPVKGGRLFAILKGAADAGLAISLPNELLPSAERIRGKLDAAKFESLRESVLNLASKRKESKKSR